MDSFGDAPGGWLTPVRQGRGVRIGGTSRAKPRDVEGPIQIAIVRYLRTVLPDALVHHARNEISKSGENIRRELHRAKVRGALKGFPDLVVLLPAHVGPLFLEVKSPKGRVDPDQATFHGRLTAMGYRIAVVRSVDDVRAALKSWGIWTREVTI